jgi:hypothetical protein
VITVRLHHKTDIGRPTAYPFSRSANERPQAANLLARHDSDGATAYARLERAIQSKSGARRIALASRGVTRVP